MTYTYEIDVPAITLRNVMDLVNHNATRLGVSDYTKTILAIRAAAQNRLNAIQNDDGKAHYVNIVSWQAYREGKDDFVRTACGVKWTPPRGDIGPREICPECYRGVKFTNVSE